LGKRGYFPNLDLSLNHVAVDTRRNWAYVTSWDGPPSHVVVVQKDKVIAVLEVPGYDVRDVVYDATHDYIYVANRLAGNMSIIRGTEVITTLNTGGVGPTYITVDEKRGYIYVSNADTHSIAVFGYDAPPDGPASLWRRFLSFVRR
jgi:DNA-binding beta-propeller fold protein YncE